tara:strand:+ start:133 stop:816 length:684 start_codon:yes stop_codon:yes gene_type:complete
MYKTYKIILLIVLINFSFPSYAHVKHYENLNQIKFEIYRNNKHIGEHTFTFLRSGDELSVKSKINFKIKKLGVVLYQYYAEGTEVFKDGKLIKFESETNQNKKIKFVKLKLNNNEYDINGSSYKGKAPTNYLLGTWWNHSIVNAPAQISAVSGRIIHQKVTFLGNEQIKIGNKNYDTLHFNFSSSDKKLSKNKKLNTDVWYDEKTLNWVKASFNKKGKWEYRLVFIE